MPSRKKINIGQVRASLDTKCTLCGHAIAPSELVRLNWERCRCPKCVGFLCLGRSTADEVKAERTM